LARFLFFFSILLYLGLGILGTAALAHIGEQEFQLGTIIAWLLGAVVAFVPFLGPLLAFPAAVQAFDWGWIGAAVVFLGGTVFTLFLLLFSGMTQAVVGGARLARGQKGEGGQER